MEIDIAGVLSRLRRLELDQGVQRCPEREAARVAVKHLAHRRHVNNIAFGMAMASRGYLPWDIRIRWRDRPHRTSKLALEDEGAGGRNRQGRPDRILCRLCPC